MRIILNTMALILKKTAKLLNRVSDIFYKSSTNVVTNQENELILPEWVLINGDSTLRLNYDLNEESLVFDVGGYKGEWSKEIFSRYCSNIHIFEPVDSYYDVIKASFIRNSKVKINKFGLGSETKSVLINLNDHLDGSSIIERTDSTITSKMKVDIVSFKDYLNQMNIFYIDLVKINIEGGEYDLLWHIINENLINCIKDIQIQFHDFVPDYQEQIKQIRKKLEVTHYSTYMYDLYWENWRKKI